MKRIPSLVLFSVAFFPVLLLADQTLTQEGLQIKVIEKKQAVEGIVDFDVEVTNTAKEARTLVGRITLDSRGTITPASPGTPPAQAVPDICPVFMEIAAGQTAKQTFPCAGKGYRTWQFTIVKIYNIIVEE